MTNAIPWRSKFKKLTQESVKLDFLHFKSYLCRRNAFYKSGMQLIDVRFNEVGYWATLLISSIMARSPPHAMWTASLSASFAFESGSDVANSRCTRKIVKFNHAFTK